MTHPAPQSASGSSAPLAVDIAQGVMTLHLQRPQAGNALSPDLVEALLAGVQHAIDTPDVHTLLLRGAGRHFCTGFDLSTLDTDSDADLLHRFVRIEQLLSAVWRAPLRTAALVHGHAWGAGADLVAACEHRAVTPMATFRFPGAQFGLVLGSRRLAERVGADRARHWIETAGVQDAAAALQAGLASTLLADAAAEQDWLASLTQPPLIDADTAAAIRLATRDPACDADLAALVRSAARPGLRQRIVDYAARAKQRSAR